MIHFYASRQAKILLLAIKPIAVSFPFRSASVNPIPQPTTSSSLQREQHAVGSEQASGAAASDSSRGRSGGELGGAQYIARRAGGQPMPWGAQG